MNMPLEGMSNSALDSTLQLVRLISLGDSKQSTGELSFQLEKCSFSCIKIFTVYTPFFHHVFPGFLEESNFTTVPQVL